MRKVSVLWPLTFYYTFNKLWIYYPLICAVPSISSGFLITSSFYEDRIILKTIKYSVRTHFIVRSYGKCTKRTRVVHRNWIHQFVYYLYSNRTQQHWVICSSSLVIISAGWKRWYFSKKRKSVFFFRSLKMLLITNKSTRTRPPFL